MGSDGSNPRRLTDPKQAAQHPSTGGGTGSQHGRGRLAGTGLAVIDECPRRVETEAPLECRCRLLLLRVRVGQGGIEIDQQRMLSVET